MGTLPPMVAGIDTKVPEAYPHDKVAAVLTANSGNISKSARDLGVNRGNLKKRIDLNPELQALLMDLRDEIVDIAEDNIYKDVREGDSGASRFVLATLGKDRGWVTRQENSNKEPIEITVRSFSDAPDQD